MDHHHPVRADHHLVQHLAVELSTIFGLVFGFLSVVAGFMQAITTTDLRLREIRQILLDGNNLLRQIRDRRS